LMETASMSASATRSELPVLATATAACRGVLLMLIR
jgi:hypothetical protein